MNEKKQKILEAAGYLLLFAFLYIWFSGVHALVAYDADDWTYLAYVRKATPIWGEWNPAKVFPEVVMPFFSTIAVYTLLPLIGDYISALTVMHAFLVSAFITGYIWCFAGLIKRTFSFSRLTAALLSALFLVLHFLVFRSQEENNLYLFYCVDLNCYYNYLLPGLLNASLVMYMMGNRKLDTFLRDGNPAVKGIFYLVVYLAIFSNLTTSGILAAYAGSRLLTDLVRRRKQFQLQSYLKENAFHLVILAAWLVSAVFELSGGRAVSAAENASVLYHLKLSFHFLAEVVLGCNRVFWAAVFVIALLSVVFLAIARGKGREEQEFLPAAVVFLVAGAAMMVYSILLCTVVDPNYIFRSEYLFGMFFYGILTVLLALAYLVKKRPQLLLALPLLLLFLTAEINTEGKTFRESNISNLKPEICAEISRDFLNQMQAADQEGLTEITLSVPVHTPDPGIEANWPHSLFLMPRISGTLYRHGIISHPITVTAVADPACNERYHLPVPSYE